MTLQQRTIVLLALAPACLAPCSALISRTHEPRLFLGISSEFWTGTLIGISLVSLAVAAYGFGKLTKN